MLREDPGFQAGSKVSYAVDFNTRVEADGTGNPLGHLDVSVLWLDDEGDIIPGPFALEITVTGEFELDEPMLTTSDAVKRWIDLNATHLLWSYARSYVSVLTSLGRHPPLTLFTISVPHPRALDREEGESDAIEAPETSSEAPPGALPQ